MTSQPPEATSQSDAPASNASSAATDNTPVSDTADSDAPSFGWNDYAERLNGRFAMLGFAAVLITQLFTRQDFWTWIGL